MEELMKEFNVKTEKELDKALEEWEKRRNEENEYYGSFIY